MGRKSNEMGLVMPDNRTVYMADDGTNTAQYKFVADKAGDLSSGEPLRPPEHHRAVGSRLRAGRRKQDEKGGGWS